MLVYVLCVPVIAIPLALALVAASSIARHMATMPARLLPFTTAPCAVSRSTMSSPSAALWPRPVDGSYSLEMPWLLPCSSANVLPGNEMGKRCERERGPRKTSARGVRRNGVAAHA